MHEHIDEQCACGCEEDTRKKHSVFTFGFLTFILGILCFLGAHIPDKLFLIELPYLYIAAYLLIGWDVVFDCFKNISRGNFFDENFLMTVVTVAVIVISLFTEASEYTEAFAVMFFYKIGQFLLAGAVRRSRSAIRGLSSRSFDTQRKSGTEQFITKFSKIYTPVVLGAAVLLAVILPLTRRGFTESLLDILPFLILACPCGIVISVPLCYFGGLGVAAKKGILLTGSDVLDKLSRGEKIAVAKSGATADEIEKADAVFTSQDATEDALLALARRVKVFALTNIVVVLSVKAALMIAAIITELPLFVDVLGDVGVTLLVILNSLRLLSAKNFKGKKNS